MAKATTKFPWDAKIKNKYTKGKKKRILQKSKPRKTLSNKRGY